MPEIIRELEDAVPDGMYVVHTADWLMHTCGCCWNALMRSGGPRESGAEVRRRVAGASCPGLRVDVEAQKVVQIISIGDSVCSLFGGIARIRPRQSHQEN